MSSFNEGLRAESAAPLSRNSHTGHGPHFFSLHHWLQPAAIAVAYALVAGIWIVYSDALVSILVTDPLRVALWSSTKGLLFDVVSAAALFFVLQKSAKINAEASQALDSCQRLQADILDALPEIVVMLDDQGRIQSWNREGLRATGYAAADVVNGYALQFIAAEDWQRSEEALRGVLDGHPTAGQARVRCKNGQLVPYYFLGVPLKDSAGHVIGALGTGRDITEQIRNQEALQHNLAGCEATLEQTIAALATLVEKRDRYLAGHQERVTELALAIGDRLDLDSDVMQGLRLASICHDIGKIHVPAEILSKPGRLSSAEFEMIKTHPEIGYEILGKIDFPWPIADIVRQHHEAMDGSGYPQHLTGENIRLEARVLAVADTVEAMTSHRPYRPGLGIDVALAEIEKGRGKRYDSKVVDACLAIFRESHFAFHQPADVRHAS